MTRLFGRPVRAASLICALAIVAAACGGDSSSSPACGPIAREPLDPAHLVHVLGRETDVTYASDPPTSGPHKASPTTAGVLDAPLDRAVQVGILERGDILLQHSPDLPAAEVTRLEALAGNGVVVAPNPDLTDPVVATAWIFARRCSAVDVASLRAFIRARLGKGPDS